MVKFRMLWGRREELPRPDLGIRESWSEDMKLKQRCKRWLWFTHGYDVESREDIAEQRNYSLVVQREDSRFGHLGNLEKISLDRPELSWEYRAGRLEKETVARPLKSVEVTRTFWTPILWSTGSNWSTQDMGRHNTLKAHLPWTLKKIFHAAVRGQAVK